MRYGWIIILWCMTAFPVMAQRMRVEDFGRYKRPFLQKSPFTTDKRQALLDFLLTRRVSSFSWKMHL